MGRMIRWSTASFVVAVLAIAGSAVVAEGAEGDSLVPEVYEQFRVQWDENARPLDATPVTVFAAASSDAVPPLGMIDAIAGAVSVVVLPDEMANLAEVFPPGRHQGDGPLSLYDAPLAEDTFPTDTIYAFGITSTSLFTGCEGRYRELAVVGDRPGIPNLSDPAAPGNPLNGADVAFSFALADCVPEFFYVEGVDGVANRYRTRVTTIVFDDGVQATVAFFAATPPIDPNTTIRFAASEFLLEDPVDTAFAESDDLTPLPEGVPIDLTSDGLNRDEMIEFLGLGTRSLIVQDGESGLVDPQESPTDGAEGEAGGGEETTGDPVDGESPSGNEAGAEDSESTEAGDEATGESSEQAAADDDDGQSTVGGESDSGSRGGLVAAVVAIAAAGAGAALVVWWRRRGAGSVAAVPPPTEEDRLVLHRPPPGYAWLIDGMNAASRVRGPDLEAELRPRGAVPLWLDAGRSARDDAGGAGDDVHIPRWGTLAGYENWPDNALTLEDRLGGQPEAEGEAEVEQSDAGSSWPSHAPSYIAMKHGRPMFGNQEGGGTWEPEQSGPAPEFTQPFPEDYEQLKNYLAENPQVYGDEDANVDDWQYFLDSGARILFLGRRSDPLWLLEKLARELPEPDASDPVKPIEFELGGVIPS